MKDLVFLVPNPFSDFKKKEIALSYFANSISNYNNQINKYKVPAFSETPQGVLDSLRDSFFVKQQLEELESVFFVPKR